MPRLFRKSKLHVASTDDEDYDNDMVEGSGVGDHEEYYYYVEGEDEAGEADEAQVEDIMDVVGDEDIIICDNIERALYLSLKYEFVTPLTSLVVIKPDEHPQEGDLSEAGPGGRHISLLSAAGNRLLIFSNDASCFIKSCLFVIAIAIVHVDL